MEKCKKQHTLPWYVKLPGGTRHTSVCCTDTACRKPFAGRADYEREKSVYVRGLDFVPRLLHADDERRELTVEKFGTALRGTYEISTPLPREHDGAIRDLVRRFHEETGCYYNDPDYKNVLHDLGKYKLCDFEHTTCDAPRDRWYLGRKHLKPA